MEQDTFHRESEDSQGKVGSPLVVGRDREGEGRVLVGFDVMLLDGYCINRYLLWMSWPHGHTLS